MKKVFALLKNVRPIKLFTAFVAGMILFFTQACNSVAATAPRQTVGEQSAPPNSEIYVPKGTNVLSPNEGGANNFSDVDPRTRGANVKARSEALKDNAEQHLQYRSGNVGENARRVLEDRGDIGKSLQERAGDIKEKTQSSAEDFARGTRKGIENIQENTSDAARNLTRNAQSAAEDTKFNAQRTADKAGSNVNQVARSAQRNLEKAGNAIKDAVD
ncbi:hypothetical protein BZZ01_31070 [Nostocales cyanobacterium HT-58-2]|nr:hypothetical protein BZZ01_31070 [Nostocales cyanobacterium HT-58-2]